MVLLNGLTAAFCMWVAFKCFETDNDALGLANFCMAMLNVYFMLE